MRWAFEFVRDFTERKTFLIEMSSQDDNVLIGHNRNVLFLD
jgi:hypothetical protein